MNSSPEYEPSQTLLLEQYKLFVEMADRNSERRGETNKFYITILTGLLALTSWAATNTHLCEVFNIVLLFISILSFVLCGIWYLNINSYRQMNRGKFDVILEMEKQLPFPCYGREWEILESGKNHRNYIPYTKIEKFIPIVLAVPYVLLLLYAICLTFF